MADLEDYVERHWTVRWVLREAEPFAQENRARGLLEELRPEARPILEELLERYAQHGPSELDLHVLEVLSLADYGTVHEIAARFGRTDRLRAAVDRLQETLRAA